MKAPQWVLRETVLAIHGQLLDGFGGLAGVRDESLLDSALNRPQQSFHYAKPDLFELAAAYASGLCGTIPFLNANRRIASLPQWCFWKSTATSSRRTRWT